MCRRSMCQFQLHQQSGIKFSGRNNIDCEMQTRLEGGSVPFNFSFNFTKGLERGIETMCSGQSASRLGSGRSRECSTDPAIRKLDADSHAKSESSITTAGEDVHSIHTKLVFPRRKEGQGRHERPNPVLLTAGIIHQYSNLPIVAAASRLGISVTALKSACRSVIPPAHARTVARTIPCPDFSASSVKVTIMADPTMHAIQQLPPKAAVSGRETRCPRA